MAPGRGWAYIGALLGGGVSIAANIAHSFVSPSGAPTGWRPEPGAVVGAVVWPVFLFVAVEILARTAWPRGFSWGVLRFAGLLPVAGVAAFVSYRHLSALLGHYGEEPIVQFLGPLAVDGLMVMATGALIATGARRATRAEVSAPVLPVPAAVLPPPVLPVSEPSASTPVLPEPAPPASAPAPRQPSPEASQVERPAPAKPRAPRKPAKATRRPVEETRKLAEEVAAADPDLTQAEVARKLQITDRRLRQVLAEAEPATGTPKPVNGAPVAASSLI